MFGLHGDKPRKLLNELEGNYLLTIKHRADADQLQKEQIGLLVGVRRSTEVALPTTVFPLDLNSARPTDIGFAKYLETMRPP